jgi:uroporphyrin-3 C-methyltransferase
MPHPEESAAAGAPEAPAAAAPARELGSRGLRPWLALVALLAAAAAALGLWHWREDEVRTRALREELARRLAALEAQGREAGEGAAEAQRALAEVRSRLATLEERLAESQSQQIALEALYQELSRDRDEWAFVEIEQALLAASQQLRLAGNVRAALAALQAAEARLQQLRRPRLAALRKAIQQDIERLKALPHADVAALGARLEELAARVEELPLAADARPRREAQPAQSAEPAERWSRLWREAWAELKSLVRIERMAEPEPPLLAPEQRYFLRENLKLRLAGARLALLARDAASYRADLRAARAWLERYYDAGDEEVARTREALRRLAEAPIEVEALDIRATLEAMRDYRIARERAGKR